MTDGPDDRVALALLVRDLYERAVRDGKERAAQHLHEALMLMADKSVGGKSDDSSKTAR